MEELDLEKLSQKIPKAMNATERAVVSNYGTVQSMLSAIFREPIEVRVVEQYEKDRILFRHVEFKLQEITIGRAISVIPAGLNRDLTTRLKESDVSIGEILRDYDYKRELLEFFVDSTTFGRTYRILGTKKLDENTKVDFTITEIFYRQYFVPYPESATSSRLIF